jgi:crotonobetainyl-CoA:carnitine CoA-transferase CaiB-like acyl-CoA transferase
LATILALFKRLRTGTCDVARTSLAANAQHIQTPLLYDHKDRLPFDEPSGPSAVGEHALYRWYKTRDGKAVFVAADVKAPGQSRQREEVCAAVRREGGPAFISWGVSSDDASDADALQALVDAECATAMEAVALFRRMGFACVPLSGMSDLRLENESLVKYFGRRQRMEQPTTRRTFHFNTVREHDIGSLVTMFAPCSILSSEVAIAVPMPAPRYGEHSREVLTGLLGFSTEEVEEMLAGGVVAEGWSKDGKYIPLGDPWSNTRPEYEERIREISRL